MSKCPQTLARWAYYHSSSFKAEEADMELIRGWESRYAPGITGGLRLSKAHVYREIGEEKGLGDPGEGEIRVTTLGRIEREDVGGSLPFPIDVEMQAEPNQPVVRVERLEPREVREIPYELQVEDSALSSPFLFCMSRKPATERDWEALRDALPERYDTWTVTEDILGVCFEVECGIKRWLALNEIVQHQMEKYRGWLTYFAGSTPPSVEPTDLGQVLGKRWFRKSSKYSAQQEYRLAWAISSPQMEVFPDTIDIELTKTGLALFKPWNPPRAFGP